MGALTTDGLASAYQMVFVTASSELRGNLIDTSGQMSIPIQVSAPVVSVVSEGSKLEELSEREIISIRILPEHDALALLVLSRVSQFQSLPDGVYALPRADLRFLAEAGIPYEKVG